jgi:DNA polymerase III epsilon subunit-like protein
VSFNVEFDMTFLDAAAGAVGHPAFENPVSCALKMARRAYPGRKSYKLADLACTIDPGPDMPHRALGDSTRALIVYAAAASKLRSVA